MRVKEDIVKQGYFWLPSNPNSKVPGTLSISDGGNIEVELIGYFENNTYQAARKVLEFKYDLERIVGHIEKYGYVTLDNCFYKKKSVSFGGISKSVIFAKKAYLGFLYDDNEVVKFNHFRFSVEGVDEWVGISGLKVTENNKKRITTIKYSPPDDIVIPLSNGMNLLITYTWITPGIPTLQEAKISQKTYFKLVSHKELSVREFALIAYKIVTLMCFAMDKTVSLEEVSSYEEIVDSSSDEVKLVPVSIYYLSHPFVQVEDKTSRGLMLFKFEDIKEDAGRIFNNWLNAYDEIDPSMHLYFSSKTGGHKYIDSKFLALFQGLETYHRRTSTDKMMEENEYSKLTESIIEQCPEEYQEWLSGRLKYGNEVNLRRRIDDIIKPYSSHFGGSKARKSLTNNIVDTRNYLTHYDESLKSSSVSNDELWILCRKIEVIYQLQFLRVLGFSEEKINSILEINLKHKLS